MPTNHYAVTSQLLNAIDDAISPLQFNYGFKKCVRQSIDSILEKNYPESPKLYKLTNNRWVEGQYKSALMFGYNKNDVKRFHPDMQMEWIPEFAEYIGEEWYNTWCSPNDVIVEEYNINLNFPTISIEK